MNQSDASTRSYENRLENLIDEALVCERRSIELRIDKG